MFQWIRNKVKAAVLAGVNDAMDALERQGASDSDDAERRLLERVQASPEPVVIEAKTRARANGVKS